MLIEPDSFLFAYAITRDFGFAPNPFHGVCTLATCKPGIRKSAKVGDWVMGIGGSSLKAQKRKCVLLMKVTEKMGFQEYWDDNRFSLKRPSRNGSRVQMLGDNIYHQDETGNWIQEDSHHSNPDGSTHHDNLNRDTGSTDQVLISNFYLYLGENALTIDLNSIDYKRIRNYKKIHLPSSVSACKLITLASNENKHIFNTVIADPCQFMDSHKRADQGSGKTS